MIPSLNLSTSLRNSIIYAAMCFARGEFLQGMFMLCWSFDQAAAPPKPMHKLLLFGNMGEIDTAVAIELADHATVSISQTHTSPHTSRHNMKMGNIVGGSFNANANYWVCHRCTFINERKRRKCTVCEGVDRARPIKYRR